MTTRTGQLIAIAATMAALAACESSTDIDPNQHFGGTMTAAKERPTPNASTATGQALIALAPNGTMSYNVTWTGLTGDVTGAHIHGPADSNNVANIIIDFAALPAGSSNQSLTTTAAGAASGSVPVTGAAVLGNGVSGDSLVKLLNAGLVYVNVHTVANAAGEIRAQIRKP